jgi:hypothetical protein
MCVSLESMSSRELGLSCVRALYVFEIVEALTYAVFQTSAVKICGAPGAVPAPPCAENRDRDRGAGVSLSGDDGESEWTLRRTSGVPRTTGGI